MNYPVRTIIAIVVLICAGAVFLMKDSISNIGKRKITSEENKIYEIKRGNLNIGIVEHGELRPNKSNDFGFDGIDTIAHTLEARFKLVWIIEEGAKVKKGDCLAKLDKSDIEKRVSTLSDEIEIEKSNLAIAQENLKIQTSANEMDIKNKQRAVDNATSSLRVYRELEAPKTLKDLEIALSIAKSALEEAEKQARIAGDEYEQELFIDESQKKTLKAKLEQTQTAVKEKKIAYESAEISYKKFKNYDFPAKISSLENSYSDALFDFKRSNNEADSKIVQKENEILKIKNSISIKEKQLKELKEGLKNMEIISPVEGVVSYYKGERRRYYDEIKVGMEIYPNGKLITIPYLADYSAKLKIGEKDRNKIKQGNKVSIKIESIPDLSLTGEVKFISPLATPLVYWDENSPKVFDAEIKVNENDERMQPGMSVRVEIVNDILKDVIFVPIEAIYEKEEKHYCYVESGGQAIEREIKIGKSNNDFIEIKEGLNEKDKVYLYSPYKKEQ